MGLCAVLLRERRRFLLRLLELPFRDKTFVAGVLARPAVPIAVPLAGLGPWARLVRGRRVALVCGGFARRTTMVHAPTSPCTKSRLEVMCPVFALVIAALPCVTKRLRLFVTSE